MFSDIKHWVELDREILLILADKFKQKGHEYYEKGYEHRDKVAIFWELEQILRDVAKKLEVKKVG